MERELAVERYSRVADSSEGVYCCRGRENTSMGRRKEESICGPYLGDGAKNDLVEAIAQDIKFGRTDDASHIEGTDGRRQGCSAVLNYLSKERRIDSDCSLSSDYA